jgi:uncharacterized protein YndB with AHSA1/START domain
MSPSTDRFEKQALLPAPRDRVWRAIGDSAEFGRWFGAAIPGPFEAGRTLKAKIVPNTVDPKLAEVQKPFEGMPFDLKVESVQPPSRFAFRWHPFAVDKSKDYSQEPMTLVSFDLADAPGGTLLTISESGFDALPEARSREARPKEEGGWAKQLETIAKYLAKAG